MSGGETPQRLETAACEVARAAGDVLRELFVERRSLDVRRKGLHDFVTEADRRAEERIVGELGRRFPEHVVMTEESAPDATGPGFRWIVDPLDGTTNFIHGVPVFAVSVAVEDRSGLLAGAVHDPLRNETFHAARGQGARLDGEPIACSRLAGLETALLATGFPFRELSRLDRYLDAFSEFVRATSGIRRAGSAAIDLAYTACGRYDGFWEIGLSRWDIAAGALLVREAGGRVTDIVGGREFLGGDILAAGPALHARMLEITAPRFA